MLQDKLVSIQVDPYLVTWILDYLTNRPQCIRLNDTTFDTVISATGVPQGTVPAPIVITLYTAYFSYTSWLCHIQKYADNTATVGCIRRDQDVEYRGLIRDFLPGAI